MPVASRTLRLLGAASLLPLLLPACDPYYDNGYGPPRGYYAEPAPGYYYSTPGAVIVEERFRDDRYREERLRAERAREEERRREEDRRHAEDRRRTEERRVESRPQQQQQQPQARQQQQQQPQPQARQEQRNQPHSGSDCGQRYGAADCKR